LPEGLSGEAIALDDNSAVLPGSNSPVLPEPAHEQAPEPSPAPAEEPASEPISLSGGKADGQGALDYQRPEESDYLEANNDYVGAAEDSVFDAADTMEERPPFENMGGDAEIQSPYSNDHQGPPRAESSTAVIVNYLDDREDSLIVDQGEYSELGAEEDLDLDLLELNNAPIFKARPMVPVPRQQR
jgi:hypothetical protein